MVEGAATDKPQVARLKLQWVMTPDVGAVYANHLLVSHQGGQFILNFAEAVVPALIAEEDFEEAKGVTVEMSPFVRIAIPTDAVPTFIKALQSNYDSYLQDKEAGIFKETE